MQTIQGDELIPTKIDLKEIVWITPFEIVDETHNGVKIHRPRHKDTWFPISQITIGRARVGIPKWLLAEKGRNPSKVKESQSPVVPRPQRKQRLLPGAHTGRVSPRESTANRSRSKKKRR